MIEKISKTEKQVEQNEGKTFNFEDLKKIFFSVESAYKYEQNKKISKKYDLQNYNSDYLKYMNQFNT